MWIITHVAVLFVTQNGVKIAQKYSYFWATLRHVLVHFSQPKKVALVVIYCLTFGEEKQFISPKSRCLSLSLSLSLSECYSIIECECNFLTDLLKETFNI